MNKIIEQIYREDFRRLFATVVRLLGDLDLAEDTLQEAFAAAMRQWPEEGVPANPRAWLVSTARFKGIDRIRKQARMQIGHDDAIARLEQEEETIVDDEHIEDDRLRLIFTCCHPAIAIDVQIALTLREVCGLSTDVIAAAFLLPTPTLAQRLVRGKAKIRSAGIPYEVPDRDHLPERLDAVLRVVYLVFNEGYHASSGDQLTRPDLAQEAIRLGRLLRDLLPDPEVLGLLALMLLNNARRYARQGPDGEIILLEHQDRSLWRKDEISEGKELLEQALASRNFGAFSLQAAIAAVHGDAATAEETDWSQIAALYQLLLRVEPSPVVELNRAVAIAMRDGPAEGLALVEAILARGELHNYHLAHAARADFYRRLGRREEARAAYKEALALAQQAPQQRFLEQRLRELGGDS